MGTVYALPWDMLYRPITRLCRPVPGSHDHGFTLIELMIVVLVIGLLAVIGQANYQSLRERARYAACTANQHHVHEAAILYQADNDIGTANLNVMALWGGGLLQQEVGECPSSGRVDFDDYTIEYTNCEVTGITCTIRGIEHLYVP